MSVRNQVTLNIVVVVVVVVVEAEVAGVSCFPLKPTSSHTFSLPQSTEFRVEGFEVFGEFLTYPPCGRASIHHQAVSLEEGVLFLWRLFRF